MSRRRYTPPRAWIAQGGKWPDGPFVVETPNYAQKTAVVVIRLERALTHDARTVRQVALAADLDPGTVSRLRAGFVVPDLGTIASLELTLQTDLWCGHGEPG